METKRRRGGVQASASKSDPPPWYQLRIVLERTQPAVWRRVAVRGDMKLDLLHAVLQLTMGWANSHLHMFLIGAEQYADPTLVGQEDWEESQDKDERKLALGQMVEGGITTFGYEYDFGDSWAHTVEVESMLPAEPAAQVIARCKDGARACPPEDCGGTPGFAQLLKVMGHPRHREYRSMVAWLGEPFNPEAFDVGETNQFLRMLKWPRTSVTSLASILGARRLARAQRKSRTGTAFRPAVANGRAPKTSLT